MQKKNSSQFFDLDIENPLGRGTLTKIESSLQLRAPHRGTSLGSCVCVGLRARSSKKGELGEVENTRNNAL